MIAKGEIKYQNMIFEVLLSINKTRNGWSQRFLRFSNENETVKMTLQQDSEKIELKMQL